MTIAQEFEYRRPETLEEALEMLAAAEGDVRLLAGGTDLVPWLRDGMIAPDLVVDIKGVEGLGEIAEDGETVSFGALVTFDDVLRSRLVADRLPMVREMAGRVGSVGIRHRATVVGNICSAVPSCDAGPVLLVYGASVHVAGPDGSREVPIDDWFLGPKRTALGPGEIVTGVSLRVPAGRHGGAYVRLSRYAGEDLAQASVAVTAMEEDRYRVAFGAVAPTPVRAAHLEACLNGRPPTADRADRAADLVADTISPITDMRASKEYRLRMSRVMLKRGLAAAVARRDGGGPAYGTSLM